MQYLFFRYVRYCLPVASFNFEVVVSAVCVAVRQAINFCSNLPLTSVKRKGKATAAFALVLAFSPLYFII